MSRFAPFILALATTVFAAAHPTAAYGRAYAHQPGATHEGDASITPMVGLSGYYGFEAGLKVDYLFATPAFVPSINDSVFLEGSIFVADKHVIVSPLLRWDFNVHPQWTVFGEAGVNVDVGHWAAVTLIAGAIWRLPNKSFFLRGEVDTNQDAVRIGPVFLF